MTAQAESGRAIQSNALPIELATHMSIIALAGPAWLSRFGTAAGHGEVRRSLPKAPGLAAGRRSGP
jgi:hypothetical protein